MEVPRTPTILVIFGVTGDLSGRKLLPALFDLYLRAQLPETFRIVGMARRTQEDAHEFMRASVTQKQHQRAPESLEAFLALVRYQQGDVADPDAYRLLGEALIAMDESLGACSNKLFYLAVPPELYETIFRNLADSGLTVPCGGRMGWTRVLVEKPFGKDLRTARELDKLLGLLFKEEQIFRIDHYLAKETLQNILAFRFSNMLFEPIWNRDYIERVEIDMRETKGVGGRGTFYESVGALRDVGQNHMLQMLALIAMENPEKLESAAIRAARRNLLACLKHIPAEEFSQFVRRGQYARYQEEAHVAPDSSVETYFRLTAFIENTRWRGVPFVLESGKCLPHDRTEIRVFFKQTRSCLCPPDAQQHHQNVLTFHIQPDEGIGVVFWAKTPGFAMALEPKTLAFSYKQHAGAQQLPDAYGRILFDCIRGDQTLFASTEEVEASWKFITPILEHWQELPLRLYAAGSEPDTS